MRSHEYWAVQGKKRLSATHSLTGVAHKQLLDYLLTDESKHDTLLEQLEQVKLGMSRASGG